MQAEQEMIDPHFPFTVGDDDMAEIQKLNHFIREKMAELTGLPTSRLPTGPLQLEDNNMTVVSRRSSLDEAIDRLPPELQEEVLRPVFDTETSETREERFMVSVTKLIDDFYKDEDREIEQVRRENEELKLQLAALKRDS